MQKNYNKDIMNWAQFPPYDILWCDPPWEQGLVKFFETRMRKDGHEPPQHSIDEILNQLAKLSDRNKPVVIEYSVKGSERVIEHMQNNGHKFVKSFNPLQSNKNPYRIMIFNSHLDINGELNGFNLITDYLSRRSKPLTIFDPFAGIGNSAKAVKRAYGNHIYIGSELNPTRFERLVKINS